MPQHSKRLGTQRHGLRTVPELLVAHVKLKGSEEENRVRVHTSFHTKIPQKLHGFFMTSRPVRTMVL
jgi:hypothetical protein